MRLSRLSSRCALPRVRIIVLLGLGLHLSSCYVFRKKSTGEGGKAGIVAPVLGVSLGEKAGELNEAALNAVHAVGTAFPPAGVRPDPDTVVRQLLLQYREPGSTVAREIGRVEEYRMLLGGANAMFTISPQETYDATSLLAELKVAKEICGSLVAPQRDQHPGWQTILPAAASDTDSNIRFLAQRLIGLPSTSIDENAISSLKAIHAAAASDGAVGYEAYVPVCATLILDAEALLL
jgi:hypothetical protein